MTAHFEVIDGVNESAGERNVPSSAEADLSKLAIAKSVEPRMGKGWIT